MRSSKALIGTVLHDPLLINRAMTFGVTVDMFEDSREKAIWDILHDYWSRGKLAAWETVEDQLRLRGNAELADSTFIEECIDSTLGAAWMESHIEEVINAKNLRNLESMLKDKLNSLQSNQVSDARVFVEECQAEIGLLNQRDGVKECVFGRMHETIDKWQAGDGNYGLPWFCNEASAWIGEITDELIYVLARRSVGKTAFALNQVAHLSGKMHKRGAYACLESTSDKLYWRLVAQTARVNTLSLKLRRCGDDKYEQARDTLKRIQTDWPLTISDDPMTVDQFAAWSKEQVDKGAEYVMLDNLKHLQFSGKYGSRVEMFVQMSSRLVAIRKMLGVPLFVLHHSNNEGVASWSSDIENDADIICLLKRSDDSVEAGHWNDFQGKTIIDFECTKNRDGQTGVMQMEFIGEHQRFVPNH